MRMSPPPTDLRALLTSLRLAPILLLASCLVGPLASAPPAAARVEARPMARPALFFVANAGQRPAEVAYYASGLDVEAAFDGRGITFTRFVPAPEGEEAGSGRAAQRGLRMDAATGQPKPGRALAAERLRLDFVDARVVRPEGRDALPTRINLLKGPREAWRTDIPTYGRIVYPELWPGIDLAYTAEAGGLEYHFRVRPGADPSRIQLAWQGAEDLTVLGDGSLEVATRSGAIRDGVPVSFQDGPAGRERIATRLVLEDAPDGPSDGGRRLRFELADHDPSRELRIDPAFLVYAGYFGASAYDRGLGIAVDAAGHAYLTGEAMDPVSQDSDAYVAKVALDGSGYDYITYIGGDGYDGAYDIVVDDAGHAYVTGPTMSDEASFPLVLGPDLSFNGVVDILVAKLAPDGQDLVYAGYLGGELTEFGEGIQVDAEGAVYLHGIVLSSEATFPVKVGPDLSFNGEADAFVAKIRPVPDASAVEDNLVYAGYIGGDRSDVTLIQNGTWSILSSGHIGIDGQGALYVSGHTTSTEASFPDGDGFGDLPGADQTWAGGWDAYVAKVLPDGSRLAYATYVGGAADDTGKGMVVDAQGRAHFTGYTLSTEASLPVTVGPDLSHNGGEEDVMVGRLSATGEAFDFLGFLGGSGVDGADSIALDAEGRIYLVGYTESGPDSFPVKGGPDGTHNDAEPGAGDAFVARLSPDPAAAEPRDNLDFAGYIGGAGYDQAFWVGLDAQGGIYVVGDTESGPDSFPNGQGMGDLAGPRQDLPGGGDGFVVKLAVEDALPPPPPSPTPDVFDPAAIYLPLGLAGAGLGEGLSTPVVRSSSPSRARVLAPQAPRQGDVRQAWSFDDFCDFAVGWAWEETGDYDLRLDVDALGECRYLMEHRTQGAYASSPYFGRSTPEDYRLETTFELEGERGAAGLIFGADETFSRVYALVVIEPGEIALLRYDDLTTVLERTAVDFDPDEPVALAVEAEGDRLSLLVNGQTVAEVEDEGPHAGRFGTYIEAFEDGGAYGARFDSIRVEIGGADGAAP